MDLFSLGQFITLMLMALAVSMDAFSFGFGVGVVGIRLRHILKVSLVIGLFHVCMPLIGILLAYSISNYFGNLAARIGGWLLVLLGIRMMWTALLGAEIKRAVNLFGISLFLLALTVSIDALSVGFSLGLFSVNTWLTVLLFGLSGTLMSFLGLLLGRNIGHWLGRYGEVLGGIVLLILGAKFIF